MVPFRLTKVQSPPAHCVGHHLNPLQVLPLSACVDYWPYLASLPPCCKYIVSLFKITVVY